MNNDRKQMVSEDPDADLFKAAKEMQEKFLDENGTVTEILLPDNVTLTPEILKNNICRICATYHESGPKLVPLYLNAEDTRSLAQIINAFLPIQVAEDDGLPQFACLSCSNKLHSWRVMFDSCKETQKMLSLHVHRLNGDPTAPYVQVQLLRDNDILYHLNLRSQLTKMVQNVLASYLDNISSMELVCQVCHLKTSSEMFHQHLNSNHKDLKSQDDIEVFVREHVTFEETLDSDGDCSSVVSAEDFEVSRRFECSTCHTEFSTRSRLSLHLRTHNASGVLCCGSNETEHCQKLESNNLACKEYDHIAADTASSAAHIAQCAGAASTREVTGHVTGQRDETNQKRIPAVCPDCNRTFSNKYNMLNHMKSHRKQTAKFECECGKSYSTRGNLVAHRRVAHLGELSHRCEECGEGFPTRSARDIHRRLHSGARPFACSVCSRAFRAKNSLDKHLETHAPRRFECALCGRRFRRKAHLRYHVGTHRRRPC